MENKALKVLINRHKKLKVDTYIEIIAFDDKKKSKEIRSTFFNINKSSLEDIQSKIDSFNIGTHGVYINLNPLSINKRSNENTLKYLYCFIDLDNATCEHKDIVVAFLEKNLIKYEYISISGGGYHILIPVDLDKKYQKEINNFTNYLKTNICDKVDLKVSDPARIYRAPLSYHHKNKPFGLETLYLKQLTEDEIKSNNEKIFKFQEETEIKSDISIKYLSSISREDTFFSEILNNTESWNDIFKMLNKHDKDNDGLGNNQILNKNLSIFVACNPQYKDKSLLFIKSWNNKYLNVKRHQLFIQKIENSNLNEDGNQVNYYELFKWAKEYNLYLFNKLLLKQLKNSFFDDYEIYYLEDEKKENSYLLYYPDKDYYIQKNFPEVILTLYYDAKERGVDLFEKFNISQEDSNGKKLTYGGRLEILKATMKTMLDKENRIKKVFNINYEPREDKFIYLDNKKYFNTYNKTKLWDYFEKKKDYNFPLIKELLINLCNKDEKSYNYFNNWLGWQIQNPTEKLPTAIIFQGRQGSGKGTLKSAVLDNIFGNNCIEINQTHLESTFNEYLLGKQIIVANEVMHNDNRQTLPNVLKNLVTDKEITISRKFKREIQGNNYTHWIFCTNSDNPIKIEEDDRRYTVMYSEKLKGNGKAAASFVKDLYSNIDHEIREYISYLKSLKINYVDVHEPLDTQAKQDIVDLNKDSVTKFVEDLKRYNTIYESFIDICKNDFNLKYIGDGNINIDTNSFYSLYIAWLELNNEKGRFNKQNFSKKLKNFGISSFVSNYKDNINDTKYKSVRVYCVENIEKVMEVVI
jgi:hypothetical protein